MADRIVIDDANVTVQAPDPGRSDRLEAHLDEIAERVANQRVRIFEAMGVISCAAAAAPDNVAEDEPDLKYALRAAYSILDDVCTELDPSVLEKEGA